MLIPIRTKSPIRRTPWTNYALIAVNVLCFVLLDVSRDLLLDPSRDESHLALAATLVNVKQSLALDASWPGLHQFVTYQFLHGDLVHLAGNMLFLWVFGNSVNAKMGNLVYLLFYLAGGMLAAYGYALSSAAPMMGASGAIAAVTTAYLVLFPRSTVVVMYVIYFIGFFELPALIMIGLKIILWDNIIAPSLGGPGNVAYGAHLAGYLVGFIGAMVMLLIRAIPRDQFDLLTLLKRWKQRQEFRAAMADPQAKAQARFGQVARLDEPSLQQRSRENVRMDEITDLRTRIGECVSAGQIGAGATLFEQLLSIDPLQCLSERNQIAVARELYATARYPQAAAAFERYLDRYPDRADDGEIRLLLGIVLARDLRQYEAADGYLTEASERLSAPTRREQAIRWLEDVRLALGKPPPDL